MIMHYFSFIFNYHLFICDIILAHLPFRGESIIFKSHGIQVFHSTQHIYIKTQVCFVEMQSDKKNYSQCTGKKYPKKQQTNKSEQRLRETYMKNSKLCTWIHYHLFSSLDGVSESECKHCAHVWWSCKVWQPFLSKIWIFWQFLQDIKSKFQFV